MNLMQSKLTQTQPSEESISLLEETVKVKRRLIESQDSCILLSRNINSNKKTSNFTQTNFIQPKGRVSFQSKHLYPRKTSTFSEN